MAPHSSILAWRVPWTEEPGRFQSMGSLRVGHNWATKRSAVDIYRYWYHNVTIYWVPTMCQCHFALTISNYYRNATVQFSCPVVSDTSRHTMDCSTPGFPVHHQLSEPAQTRVHQVSDAIPPSHPLSFPSPRALNLSIIFNTFVL